MKTDQHLDFAADATPAVKPGRAGRRGKKRNRGLGLIGVSLSFIVMGGMLGGSLIAYQQLNASATAKQVYMSSFNIQEQIRAIPRTGRDLMTLPGEMQAGHLVVDPRIYDEGDLAAYRLSVRAYVDETDIGNVMLVFERAPLSSCRRIRQRLQTMSAGSIITGCGEHDGEEVLYMGFWGASGGRMAYPEWEPTPISFDPDPIEPAPEPAAPEPEPVLEPTPGPTPADPPQEPEPAPQDPAPADPAPSDPDPVEPAPPAEPSPTPPDPEPQPDPAPTNPGNGNGSGGNGNGNNGNGNGNGGNGGGGNGGGGQHRNDCWQPFISCSGLGDGTNPGQGSGNNNAGGTPGGDGVTNPGGTGGGGNGNP